MYIRHLTKTLFAGSVASALVIGCGDDTGSKDPDPKGCMTQADITCSGNTCTVPAGNFEGAISFDGDKVYNLEGRTFMGNGDDCNAQLTIAPGSRIQGFKASKGYLAILPNSTINANGTADKPIVFTSGESNPARGDWGGLIISGNATVNCAAQGGTCNGEGDTGTYGGTNDDDNSGVLRYVRVEYGGNKVNPTDELNGIAFQGVGRGTTVENIHVHQSDDDGVEFFGGAVNVKRLVVTGVGDDSIDWVFGWHGKLQFAIVQQDGAGDQGIEADNNEDAPDAEPRSNPILSNVTLIGSPFSDKSDIGILLREGTGGQIWNAIVTGFNDAGLDIDNTATFTNAMTAGNLAIRNSMFFNENLADMAGCGLEEPMPAEGMNCASNFKNDDDDAFSMVDFVTTDMYGSAGNEVDVDPGLPPAHLDTANPDFVPMGGSAALSGGTVPNDAFFENVSFRGGVGPDDVWYSWIYN